MKRKIALLLAFTMIFSLVPMTVGARVIGGPGPGGVPTIPDSRNTEITGGFVVGPFGTQDIFNEENLFTTQPNRRPWHYYRNGLNALRYLDFAATNYVLHNDVAVHWAWVEMSGLGDNGLLLPYINRGQTHAQIHASTSPAAIMGRIDSSAITIPEDVRDSIESALDGWDRNHGRHTIDNNGRLPNRNWELLAHDHVAGVHIGQGGWAGHIDALLIRDYNHRNRALLVIVVDDDDPNAFPAGLGVRLGIPYLTMSNANVNMRVVSGPGSSIPTTTILMGTRRTDDFEFDVYDDVPVFHTRTAIPAIEIIEPDSMGFDTGWWQVELTLDRGFSWARRHDSTTIEIESMLGVAGAGPVRNSDTGTANNRVATRIEHVARDTNRRLVTAPFFLAGAVTPNRLADTIRVGWDETLQIQADDHARPGPVRVEVTLYRAGAGVETGNVGMTNVWRRTVSRTDGAGGYIHGYQHLYSQAQPENLPNIGQTFNYVSGTTVLVGTEINRNLPSNAVIYVESNWALFGQVPVTGTGVQRRWDYYRVRDREVASGFVTVAYFDREEILVYLYEDHDLNDFERMTGAREWEWAGWRPGWNDSTWGTNWGTNTAGPGGAFQGAWDAVVPESVDEYHHLTATVVLTESVPGALPFTGLPETIFRFDEGIQVLGVHVDTNDANFFNLRRDDFGAYADCPYAEHFYWFIDGLGQSREGALDVLVRRDYVSMRPHIEEHDTIARVYATFYLSIQAGFEHLYGEDINVYVNFRGGTAPTFEDYVTIALARDPITVSTVPVTLDDEGEAAWGRIRHERLSDIVIHEQWPGALRRGYTLWVGVEGGVSLGWGHADLVSLAAANVTIDNYADSRMRLSSPVRDQRGVFVEIDFESVVEPAVIRFSGVEISGVLMPLTDYDIIVAGSAVADNFGVSAFVWEGPLFGGGAFTRLAHGTFAAEPYPTAAFEFIGDEHYVAPPQQGPQDPQTPIIPPAGPVTFNLNSSHTTSDGDFVHAPVFQLVPNVQNPAYVTSYVSARVVADLAGLPWGPGFSGWDAATNTATFSDGVTVVTFTAGSQQATVNGVPQQITAGGLQADARIIGDRIFVPISFFNALPWNIRVQWNPYTTPADRSITIFPAG